MSEAGAQGGRRGAALALAGFAGFAASAASAAGSHQSFGCPIRLQGVIFSIAVD